jgi:membrane-associated phospholipid phosphatase
VAESPREGRDTARLGDRSGLVVTAVSGGCLAVTDLLAVTLRSTITAPDRWIHVYALHHRDMDLGFLRTLTQGGSTRVIWPVLAVAAVVFPRTRGWRRLATTAGFFGAAAAGIGVRLETSLLVQRPRPTTVDWMTTAGGYAFPSGHTMAATLGAGALAWAVTRHMSRRMARGFVWAAVVLYAGMIGWTRVWLGVHWPLDVVGSWLLGVGWLCGMAMLNRVFAPQTGESSGSRRSRASTPGGPESAAPEPRGHAVLSPAAAHSA